jgi:hypothetical protein
MVGSMRLALVEERRKDEGVLGEHVHAGIKSIADSGRGWG